MHPILIDFGLLELPDLRRPGGPRRGRGAVTVKLRGDRAGLDGSAARRPRLWVVIWALVGSKGTLVLVELPRYLADPAELLGRRAGGRRVPRRLRRRPRRRRRAGPPLPAGVAADARRDRPLARPGSRHRPGRLPDGGLLLGQPLRPSLGGHLPDPRAQPTWALPSASRSTPTRSTRRCIDLALYVALLSLPLPAPAAGPEWSSRPTWSPTGGGGSCSSGPAGDAARGFCSAACSPPASSSPSPCRWPARRCGRGRAVRRGRRRETSRWGRVRPVMSALHRFVAPGPRRRAARPLPRRPPRRVDPLPRPPPDRRRPRDCSTAGPRPSPRPWSRPAIASRSTSPRRGRSRSGRRGHPAGRPPRGRRPAGAQQAARAGHPPGRRQPRRDPGQRPARTTAATCPAIGGVERPGIVHRLDKDTSGLLVVAKTRPRPPRPVPGVPPARRSRRRYLAVVLRHAEGRRGGRRGAHRPPPAPSASRWRWSASGRQARTLYRVVRSARRHVPPRLPPGHRPHPPDPGPHGPRRPRPGRRPGLYAGRQWRASPTREPAACRDFPRQALHAWRLVFTHPVTERRLELEAPWPDDLAALVALLRARRDALQRGSP